MVLGLPKRALIIGLVLVGIVLIYVVGTEPPEQGQSDPTVACEVSVTADVLNVRAAPTTRAPVVGQYEQATTVTALPTVQNGFRMLDVDRWAADDFLDPVDAAAC